ncbi:hypothetical protein E3N88_28082 [Mikania micrantha]|uniref:ALOG domain-containing protein n=1 Tax=Mikania micrantha TaxID=192012 RepID=A0A5N6MZ40_9ASTR|nr:hypothetical protein E3N88_28082 [Mikania micrantha]
MIAPYFESLSTIKELDLSHTNIQSLPPSISMLSLLVNLTLKECSMLLVIPPEIGMLKNLRTFDLEGTEIMYLPKEMGKLENLQCLRVSFCAYADEYKDYNGIENIIPRAMMSKFRMLEELSICVNPNAKWWEFEVREAILENLIFLPCLHTLKLHLPTAKELQYFLRLENHHVPIYSTLRDLRLEVGHSEQLTSYVKTELVDSFEKLEKCLKYENGEGSTDDIKELVSQAEALFVCRHWTIEMLSIFDIRRLKYCLLMECNNMRNIVDADYSMENAFEFLEYLAVHSMKNLQSIWKGPITRNSFSCLQVLALHTCPDLITVFTGQMLDNLHNLTVVIVEDCPKVKSLVSPRSTYGSRDYIFLSNLRKILLLDLPELVSLSNGLYIAPQLETLLVYNCMKLDCLSRNELSSNVNEIKGETEWWDALRNRTEWSRAFVPLERDGDLMNQLLEDTNSLKEFHKLQGHGGPSKISSSTFVPSDSRPLPAQSSLYETKKHLDWGMFMQFLKYRKPPVPFFQCNSGHVIEFLKYLNKFGDIRVHVQNCVLFGHPNPAATCFCPLREAWGTLEVIATRLHAAYEENRFPYMETFGSSDLQAYLYEIRKSQEDAMGIPFKMHDFSILTEDYAARPMNDEKQGTMNNENSKRKERIKAKTPLQLIHGVPTLFRVAIMPLKSSPSCLRIRMRTSSSSIGQSTRATSSDVKASVLNFTTNHHCYCRKPLLPPSPELVPSPELSPDSGHCRRVYTPRFGVKRPKSCVSDAIKGCPDLLPLPTRGDLLLLSPSSGLGFRRVNQSPIDLVSTKLLPPSSPDYGSCAVTAGLGFHRHNRSDCSSLLLFGVYSTASAVIRVRVIPRLETKLVFVGQLDEQGLDVKFGGGRWKVVKKSLVIAKGFKTRSLYLVLVPSGEVTNPVKTNAKVKLADSRVKRVQFTAKDSRTLGNV